MVDGISTLFHLLYGCSTSESCLSRQIKKRVRADPGGGEAGLIREHQRLHQPLALNVFTVMFDHLCHTGDFPIKQHRYSFLVQRGCLLLTAVFHHQAYPSRLFPPSLLLDGRSAQHIHEEGPKALPSPISALRDERVKERQEVNLPETRVVLWWGEEGYCSPILAFFPLGSSTRTCRSTMDPHITEGKQDGLLSQQISEMTEGPCVSVHSTTSQFCDFGLLNIPVISAFEIMICIRTRGGIEFLILWDWEFLN